MKNRKTIISLLVAGGLLLASASVLVIQYCAGESYGDLIMRSSGWKVRRGEIRSRLLDSPMLLYHAIDGKGLYSLTLEAVRSHFRLFRDRGVRVISFREFFERLDDPKPFEGKVMMLSFDDSYFSMYTRLMPLLSEFHYPVTLFLFTGPIGAKSHDSLSWRQLREMEKCGIEIQSHTVTHPDLVKLQKKGTPESRRRLFEEIYLSKREIELYLKRPVRYFAFPFGSYDQGVVELCRYAGYERVFTTDEGPNIVTRNNYCIRRQHVLRTHPISRVESFIR